MNLLLFHQLSAGVAPWLFLSLLCLGRNPYLSPLRISISFILSFLILLIPVDGWPLFSWIRTLEPNPSFLLTGLLAVALFQRLSARRIFRPTDWNAAWIVGSLAALSLYPMGLGLTPLDPYVWGWEMTLPMVTTIIATGLLLCGNRFGILLLLPPLGFLFHLQESDNFWDAVVDPFYGVFSLAAVMMMLIRRIRKSPVFNSRV